MDQAYVEALHLALEQTIAPDTQVIKSATVQLNTHFYVNAQCVPALFSIATSSPNAAIRQLALVEIRKRVTAKKSKQWTGQVVDTRLAIKARLLELLSSETSAPVRSAGGRFLAQLARIELENGTWPELHPWLWTLASSPTAAQREVAMQAVFLLSDTLVVTPAKPGGSIDGHVMTLLQLFARTIGDETLAVRVWTLRGLGKVAEYIEIGEEEDIAMFQSLVPAIVGVLSQTLEADDEAAVKAGFEVLEGLALAEPPLISTHLAPLVEFMLIASANTAYDNDNRIIVLNGLLWIVKFKKSKIQSLNLAGPIINALLPIGAEPEPEDVEEDVPARTAFRVIDTLATSLPPAQVFPPLFAQVMELFASPNPSMRKSAIMAFGVVVEGCSLFIQPHLESLWPLIIGGLSDPEVIVRKASCSALMCLCEMLEEECALQHAVLLPLIFNLISDSETQKTACSALDCLLEVLGADIVPYIPNLMDSLLRLLDSAPFTLKGTVVGAIGSAAHASKAQFLPYFEASMSRIVPFLSLTEEGDSLDLRGIAQDTVGTLAEAVGKDNFRPYFAPLMEAAFQAMAVPNAPQLKECSYIFFAVISRVYTEEFAAYLPTVMPLLLAAISQSEIDEETLLASAANAEAYTTGVDDDEDDAFEDIDDDGDDDDDDAMFNASTALAIEKECAADAISEIFAHVKAPFLPYVEAVVRSLLPGLKHGWHDGIRKSAAAALLGFISTFSDMSNEESKVDKWSPDNIRPLQENVVQLASAILPSIFEMWDEEEDRDVVHELCSSLSATLMSVGPALLDATYVSRICKHLIALLNRTAPCQMDDEVDEEAAANAEQSEYDAALVSAACDLVGTLATILGQEFASLFTTFLPAMAQYYDPARSQGDRSTAIGALAEIVNGLRTAVTPFTSDLYPLFLRALRDPEFEVSSNAAFAVGSLVLHTQADLSTHYVEILGALHPLFEATPAGGPTKRDNARDNAVGAVARMIITKVDAVPLDQVLPIFLSALPLKRDFAESGKTFEAIFQLFRVSNPIILQNLDHILSVFQQALASVATGYFPDTEGAQITEETKNRVLELLAAIEAQR